MTLTMKKKNAEKVNPSIRWWKLKDTSCQEAFREEVARFLGGKDRLSDECDKTAKVLRKTAEMCWEWHLGNKKEIGKYDGGMRKYRKA